MRPNTLGVIGLGAIGGSVAWQASQTGVARIVGYTTMPKDGVAAVRAGAVTELANDPQRVVRLAELLVIATPPQVTIDMLRSLAEPIKQRGLMATDVASVKGAVCRAAADSGLAAQFAGSHPFAGTHQQGFSGARPDRFKGQVVYVCPLEGGHRAAEEVADFWTRVMTAHVVLLDPEQHDRTLAWTSHLPQAVSSALAAALGRHSPDGARFGSGALSTTRLAGSGVDMWTDVLLLNREHVIRALAGLDATVAELRQALESGNAAEVRAWLETGLAWRRKHDS